jgi:ribosomal protein L11 methyltransferase
MSWRTATMKTSKTLWRISVTTTLEAEEAITELLGGIFGLPASSHFNVETRVSVVSVFGPQKIIAARAAREQLAAGLTRIKSCGLNLGAGRIKTANVRREDWSESWKRHFKAMEIGDALLIKPSWIKRKPRKSQAVVVLDPGLSFGTGQHATTSFCLREIVKYRPVTTVYDRRSRRSHNAATAKSFLDIGTGSGILAIAAAKLGYQPVRAFDFDPESVRVAAANARVNHVAAKIKLTQDDVTRQSLRPERQYDLVCANLISNLLIEERRRIVAQMKRDGTLVLAGILQLEFAQVQTAFEDLGLKLAASKTEKEWRSGSFRFPVN